MILFKLIIEEELRIIPCRVHHTLTNHHLYDPISKVSYEYGVTTTSFPQSNQIRKSMLPSLSLHQELYGDIKFTPIYVIHRKICPSKFSQLKNPYHREESMWNPCGHSWPKWCHTTTTWGPHDTHIILVSKHSFSSLILCF